VRNSEQKRLRILLAIKEPVGDKLNAMGIRYLEFATFLGAKYETTLIAPHSGGSTEKFNFTYMPYTLRDCARSVRTADLLIVTNPHPLLLLVARLFNKKIILDLYDPTLIENLERIECLPLKEKMQLNSIFRSWIKLQIQQSDHYLCANERQKSLWLGVLALLGKLNSKSYSHDKDAGGLISMVPTGVSDSLPAKSQNVLRDVLPGIKETDRILLWVGAPSRFFDCTTLINAMGKISKERDDIKLVVISGNPEHSELLKENVQLSDSLGLTNKTVYFIGEWVPYDKMVDYYLESDVGISLHYSHLETYFSMRNRTLGYFWGCLPVIATRGDFWAELIEKNNWGIVVNEKDEHEFVEAVTKLLNDSQAYQNCRIAIERDMPDYRWSKVLTKLDAAVKLAGETRVENRIFNVLSLVIGSTVLALKYICYKFRYGSVRSRIEQSSSPGSHVQ